MYPAFLCSRKPPAGRVGAYRIRPPTRPGIRGECVFLVFKHRFIVIQAPFKRHSNSSLRAVGEGRQGRSQAGRVPQKPVPSKLRQRPASAEAGKLAGYLKARTKQTSPASVNAPRPRKVSKHAAERFRGLGKLQNAPLNVSEASESIKTRR